MTLQPRTVGRLSELPASERRAIVERARGAIDQTVSSRVAAILARVRSDGDRALLYITREIDGVELASLAVPPEALERARASLDVGIARALDRAVKNLERFHRALLPAPVEVETEPGVRVGRRADPLRAVGVYAPGGRAVYPSSVLMGVVPAKVAGVAEIVVCSPPSRSGLPSDVVLAAAVIAGATRVVPLGGAQAIAALAFGSQSVPRVDRITGPGNAYVAEAKRQVAGFTGIDSPAGPSEILVIADDSASPEHIVLELLAQAEHDPEASCVAVCTSERVASEIVRALERAQPDKIEVIRESISVRGAVLTVADLDEALAFTEEYAPEHLLLAVADPEAVLARVRHAGTVFFGAGASVAFGDYMTGANHVLPTAGAARAFSGLSTLDCVRFTTYQRISGPGGARLSSDTALLATAEGLPAHAAAARAHGGPETAPSFEPPSARPSYREMKLYSSNRKAAPIDLSDNTNPLGAPPSALAFVSAEENESLCRYPTHYGEELKAALAERLGISTDEIVTGCGSDDVLDSAIRAFAAPGERLSYPSPTFAMLPFFCKMNGLEPCPIPLGNKEDRYDIDVGRMLEADARVYYVCSPNNPTGTLASPRAIDALLEGARGLVILDEAYIEYAGPSRVREAKAAGRLLVVRTLSKAYGLAGARVGYGVGAPEIVSEVEKSRGPYKITRIAERIAVKVLSKDTDWVDAGVAGLRDARSRFEAWLGERGVAFVPSAANFVLVLVPGANERALRLRAGGVAVRAFPSLPGFGDALRISLAPWPSLEKILPLLAEALA